MKKAPVLPQRGKDGACKGIIRLCRCCMPLLGNKNRGASVSPLRVPKDRPCIGGHPEGVICCRRRLAAVSVPGDGEDHSVSCGFYSGDPGRGPRAVESGSSPRSSVDGPVIAPCRRREVLAPQAWHRLHSEPCPAWGGKRWWRAAGCLPCRRSGGCPGWTGPECAS